MRLISGLCLSLFVSVTMAANDFKITGTVDQIIQSTQGSLLKAAPSTVKHVALLKVELSDQVRQKIEHKAEQALNQAQHVLKGTASKVQLGMGNVPVLNQGSYGSCVTFANTAAIDAALNKGDYISQLCSLQLGRYLEENGYTMSGWDGSLGGMVLNQMSVFGLVSKAKQKSVGCGGLVDYPLNTSFEQNGTPMLPEDYHRISEPMETISWSSVADVYQVFLDKMNTEDLLLTVKKTLDMKDRLTFGVLLPGVDLGVVGAVGTYQKRYDSWVLTPEIIEHVTSDDDLPGHEMVITGYDDAAVAIDNKGRSHKGLFTLRISWGTRVGDHGNFYMTYDYFKALVMEVNRIRQLD